MAERLFGVIASNFDMMQPMKDLYSKCVGTGEAILMIHGVMSDHENFNRIQQILGRDYKTITYDRRGYGVDFDLSYADQDYSVKTQAEEAISVLKHYTEAPSFIIGDSTGGDIAIQTAILFPRFVKGIFLVETTISCDGLDLSCLHEWRNSVRHIARSNNIYSVIPLFAKMIGSKPTAQKSDLKNIKKTIYNIRNYIYGEMKDITDYSFAYNEVSNIPCPVIMGISSEGKDLPFGIGAKRTADFFGWETVYLPGYHNTIQEYPYEFSLHVLTFFKSISANNLLHRGVSDIVP